MGIARSNWREGFRGVNSVLTRGQRRSNWREVIRSVLSLLKGNAGSNRREGTGGVSFFLT